MIFEIADYLAQLRTDFSVGEGTPQTRFAITFVDSADAEAGAGFTGMRYCVHDPVNEDWAMYVAVFVTGGVGGGLCGSAQESERWVSFEADEVARVTDFGGTVMYWEAGLTLPEQTRSESAPPSCFYLAHPLFPPTFGEADAVVRRRYERFLREEEPVRRQYREGRISWGEYRRWRRSQGDNRFGGNTFPDALAWAPLQHYLSLPTGTGGALGAAIGRGGSTPWDADTDEHVPWDGFAPPA